jgi:hypothetical protein
MLAVMLSACGGGGSGEVADADPNAPDADPNAPDAAPGTPDAAGPGTPDAAAPQLQNCYQTCDSPADCTLGQVGGIADADNYECDGTRCHYQGCNSTAECELEYSSTAYVCGTVTGSPLPACYMSCGSPADCVIGTTPIYQADNFECDAGKCRWTGCNDAQECAETYMDSSYTCHPSGNGTDACYKTCVSASDCVLPGSPLYDVDNWACSGNVCMWDGCNATSECTAVYMDPEYICQ